MIVFIIIFQEEVVREEAGEEALDLGLLIGAEDPDPQEEETEMLCFPHLLFQEFVAANYVSVLTKGTLPYAPGNLGALVSFSGIYCLKCVSAVFWLSFNHLLHRAWAK